MLVRGATDQYCGPLCGVHRRASDSPHKGPVIRKAFITCCDVTNSYRSTRSISLQQPLPEKAEEAWFRPWHVEPLDFRGLRLRSDFPYCHWTSLLLKYNTTLSRYNMINFHQYTPHWTWVEWVKRSSIIRRLIISKVLIIETPSM